MIRINPSKIYKKLWTNNIYIIIMNKLKNFNKNRKTL